MARPFILAQISDPHLGEPPIAGVKPKKSLREVLAAIEALPNPVDAILVSGDLAEHAKPKEYALARELIGGLGVPVQVLPGNKDDRATMREKPIANSMVIRQTMVKRRASICLGPHSIGDNFNHRL